MSMQLYNLFTDIRIVSPFLYKRQKKYISFDVNEPFHDYQINSSIDSMIDRSKIPKTRFPFGTLLVHKTICIVISNVVHALQYIILIYVSLQKREIMGYMMNIPLSHAIAKQRI